MASRRRQGRIVGGTDAPRWAAPWQVAVRQRQPPGSLVCGGVLIEHSHPEIQDGRHKHWSK